MSGYDYTYQSNEDVQTDHARNECLRLQDEAEKAFQRRFLGRERIAPGMQGFVGRTAYTGPLTIGE